MFAAFKLRRDWRPVKPTEDILAARYAAEFSRPFEVARIRDRQSRVRLAASDVERAELANRLGLVTLERLEADAALAASTNENTFRLAVDWVADVVQCCVVSLEPIASRLTDRFELFYVAMPERPESADDTRCDVQIDFEGRDPPELIIGDRIDVGEAIVEHLALALDAYPRKPGVSISTEYLAEGEEQGRRQKPFTKLTELAPKR